ncbi:unnamed protein product [Rangifer tarandus platyrhynchus]|uniref:Uncharacterized protein n=1 Tax=Rangifer tarandus platyrhynchus TaxID=3082113 RepID=A0AC59YA51_RANTA
MGAWNSQTCLGAMRESGAGEGVSCDSPETATSSCPSRPPANPTPLTPGPQSPGKSTKGLGYSSWEQKEKGDGGRRQKNFEVQERCTDRVHKGDDIFQQSDNKVERVWGRGGGCCEERTEAENGNTRNTRPRGYQSQVRPLCKGPRSSLTPRTTPVKVRALPSFPSRGQ